MSREAESSHQTNVSCSQSAIAMLRLSLKINVRAMQTHSEREACMQQCCLQWPLHFCMRLLIILMLPCLPWYITATCSKELHCACSSWMNPYISVTPSLLCPNVSCSPSGVRNGISFLSRWQLWNISLCLSSLVCNLPLNFGIHSNFAAL